MSEISALGKISSSRSSLATKPVPDQSKLHENLGSKIKMFNYTSSHGGWSIQLGFILRLGVMNTFVTCSVGNQ